MRIGDRVKTITGQGTSAIGTIKKIEDVGPRRYGVLHAETPAGYEDTMHLYPDNIMYFFEGEVTKIQ